MNQKMKKFYNTVIYTMLKYLPDPYLEFLFADIINPEDIAMEIMFECCKYAYDQTAPKKSLRAHLGAPSDNDRMLYQRIVKKINDYRLQEYEMHKQNGHNIEGLIPPSMKTMPEKLEGYTFNDFQFWEINNVHNMRFVTAIADNKIVSKNFKKETFIEYAEEYDTVIKEMISRSEKSDRDFVFASLAVYVLAWKYSFDFYYRIACRMEEQKIKKIEDLTKKCSLFCGFVGIDSILDMIDGSYRCNGGRIFTDSRMVVLREKYVPKFIDLSDEDTLRYQEAIVTVETQLLYTTYYGQNIRQWFVENTSFEDWSSVMRDYNVFQIFEPEKHWTPKRVRFVKEIYSSLRTLDENPDFRSLQ